MPLPSSRQATWRPAEPGDASAGGQPLPRGTGAGLHPGLWESAGRVREVGWAAQAPALVALTQGVGLSGSVCWAWQAGSPASVLLHSGICQGGLSGGLFSDLELSKAQLAALGPDCRLDS